MRVWLCAAWIGAAGLLLPGVATAQNAPQNQSAQQAPPSSPAPAQQPNQPQHPAQPAPPPQKFRAADGELRMSQLLGATVINDQNQQIGTISDVLLDKQMKADRTVLSVGGFLGVGSRLVQVPFSSLKIEADKIILPGATKVSLENLSAYQAQ